MGQPKAKGDMIDVQHLPYILKMNAKVITTQQARVSKEPSEYIDHIWPA